MTELITAIFRKIESIGWFKEGKGWLLEGNYIQKPREAFKSESFPVFFYIRVGNSNYTTDTLTVKVNSSNSIACPSANSLTTSNESACTS